MKFSAIEMKPHCTNYGIALKSMQINLQTNFRIILQSDNHIWNQGSPNPVYVQF